jgi:hypothetical protein
MSPFIEACRKTGIVNQTVYRWNKEYISMGAAVVR